MSAIRGPDHARPFGIKNLGSGLYRLRVGDWRVIYAIDDAALIVRVARIVRRNERTYGFL